MNADSGTHANFRNFVVARTEVSSFVSWLQRREDFTQAEKDRLASLAKGYKRTGERAT
jgi:hypothetical protein